MLNTASELKCKKTWKLADQDLNTTLFHICSENETVKKEALGTINLFLKHLIY